LALTEEIQAPTLDPQRGKIRLIVEAQISNPKFFHDFLWSLTRAERAGTKLAILHNFRSDMRVAMSVDFETIQAPIQGETK